jgi:hypothetical protein
MAIILQPKRLLITEFRDDDAFQKFLRWVTIVKTGMYFERLSEWVAAFEVMYNGEPAIAVPRRFKRDILEDIADTSEQIKDSYYIPASSRDVNVEAEPRSELQAEMLDFLLGRGNYSKLAKLARRALFASTGTGKTFLTLKYISIKKTLAFINCPDDKAILTWKQEAEKFTDIKPTEIFTLAGRDSLAKLLKNKEKYKLVLASSKTFSSLIIDRQFDLMQNFFDELQPGLMVHDEVHLNIIVLFYLEMMVSSKNTLYLTATPTRKMYKETKLLESLMPSEECIYDEGAKQRFDFWALTYHSNAPKGHTKGLAKPNGFDYINYGKKIIFNPNKELPYRDFFLDTVIRKCVNQATKMLSKPTNKIAILGRTKEDNDIIYSYLKEKYPKRTVGLFNSDIEDIDERWKETDAQLIVSTDKSFAGIINIKDLEVIINIYPITSESHIKQIMGRIRDEPNKKSIFMQLCDGTLKKCKKSLYNETRTVEDICTEIHKVTLNPPETNVEEEDE